jgi:hypothetical protein
VDGFEIQEARLNKLGRTTLRAVVEAGAKAAEKVMADATTQYSHTRNRDMLDSIGNNGIREYYGGASTEVYPQGNDRKGVRNATKAYVINYGKGQRPLTKWPRKRPKINKTGDKFITGNEGKTEQAVVEAMQAESDRLLSEI